MPPQPQPRLTDLLNKAVADAKRLANAQVALLKTEVAASSAQAGKGAGLGIATAAIMGFATLFLLLTIAFVLVALGLPIWAGMLIVTVLLIIAATVTGLLAKSSFEKTSPPSLAMAEFEKTKAALAGTPVTDLPVTVEPPPTPGL